MEPAQPPAANERKVYFQKCYTDNIKDFHSKTEDEVELQPVQQSPTEYLMATISLVIVSTQNLHYSLFLTARKI